MVVCQNPKCQESGPMFNDKGQHNFCPTSGKNGGVITVCMKCKSAEEAARRQRDKQ